MALDVAAIQQTLRADGRGRLAALRLSRLQPDRRAAGGPDRRRAHDHAPLVLPHSRDGRAARPGARHRAAQPRRAAGREGASTPGAPAARRRADAGCWRAPARRDGILAGVRDSVPVAARCRHGGAIRARAASRSCRRATSCSGSRPPGRAAAAGDPPGGVGGALPDQGPRVRRRSACGSSAAAARCTEYDLQQQMVGWFEEEGLVSDSAPVVAVGAHAGNPALPADRRRAAPIAAGPGPAAGPLGQAAASRARCSPTSRGSASPADRAGRRRPGVRCDRARPGRGGRAGRRRRPQRPRRCAAGRSIARRATCSQHAGYGEHILHRTGHSLGESVHGNGVHLDDYETHDDRRILPGTGFTIEPGLYFDDLRRPDRDQHVPRGAGRRGDRPAATGTGDLDRDAAVRIARTSSTYVHVIESRQISSSGLLQRGLDTCRTAKPRSSTLC